MFFIDFHVFRGMDAKVTHEKRETSENLTFEHFQISKKRNYHSSSAELYSHAGKTHLFRKVQVLRFSKSTFYPHWNSFSVVFYFFAFFLFLGATSKIAVLLACELNSADLE